MLNHLTAEKRLQALGLVREGHLYDLGRVLDEHVPVFPGRSFHQTLTGPAAAAARPPSTARMTSQRSRRLMPGLVDGLRPLMIAGPQA